MNKGIITKIHIDEDGVKYNIRLDRNVKIPENDKDGVEYNIYIDYIDSDPPKACLFKTTTDCVFGANVVIANIGCKCEFELNFDEFDKGGNIKIVKISYER